MSEGKPAFTFYDGPPFATGLPHYGHLLAGTIKVYILNIFFLKKKINFKNYLKDYLIYYIKFKNYLKDYLIYYIKFHD